MGDVARAWLAYELGVGTYGPNEIVLVANDSRRYVAASLAAAAYLDLGTDELLGMRIEDVTCPVEREGVRARWDAFIRSGGASGSFVLWRRDGQQIPTTFRAKANTPIPGLHVTRMVPVATWVNRTTLIEETDRALVSALDAIAETRGLLEQLRGPVPRIIRGRPPAPAHAVTARAGPMNELPVSDVG